MEYTEYTAPETNVSQYYVQMSDGVSLKMLDFQPGADSSSKPIILFVAGWISQLQGWKSVLKELTSEYRVMYLETREKRSSLIPEGKKNKEISFRVSRMVEDLHEVVQQVIPEKKSFAIGGSSLGSSIVLEYLSHRTREPLCAMLISPLPVFRFPAVLGDILPALPPSLYLVIKKFVIWYLVNFRLDKTKEKEQVEKYTNTINAADPYKLKYNALDLKRYSLMERLQYITTPCYIFGAKTDTLHETDTIQTMIEKMHRAKYIELASNKETHSEVVAEWMVNLLQKKEYKKI